MQQDVGQVGPRFQPVPLGSRQDRQQHGRTGAGFFDPRIASFCVYTELCITAKIGLRAIGKISDIWRMSPEPLVTEEVIARQTPEAQAIIRLLLARIAKQDRRISVLEAEVSALKKSWLEGRKHPGILRFRPVPNIRMPSRREIQTRRDPGKNKAANRGIPNMTDR